MKPTPRMPPITPPHKIPFCQAGAAVAKTDAQGEIQELLAALHDVRNGDFSVRLPNDWTLLWGKVADVFNDDRRHQ